MTLPTHITHIKPWGPRTGPRVLLLGGTHGDEQAGIRLATYLQTFFLIHQLRRSSDVQLLSHLFIGFGNPAAMHKHSRAASHMKDLNRCFSQELLSDQDVQFEDVQRARALAPFLKEIDLLIDLHSTSRPSAPFLCCERITPRIAQTASCLPADRVLTDPNHILEEEPMSQHPTMDSFVNRSGGVGLCFETGQATDFSSLQHLARELIFSLARLGVLCLRSIPPQQHFQQHFALTRRIDAKKDGFTFSEEFKHGWEQVHRGDIIGTYASGEKETVSQDGLLLFPRATDRIKQGKSLYYLAEEIEKDPFWDPVSRRS